MESEGSGGSEGDKRKGAFNIPSVSEIKRANRVPVVTSAPAIFRQQHHRPLDTNQEGVAAAPKPRPTTITDAAAGEGSRDPVREGDSASTKLSSADRVGRKRTREGLDSPKQIVSTKSTVIVTNERVVLQQGSDKTPAAASTAVSGATGVTGGERSFVASSDGVGASVTASTSAPAHHPHAIITNPVQKKNPVIKHIRNVPWELGDIVPDFVLGKTTCAMFLSVRYHSLHPNYIHSRLKELGKQYQLRILLILVDMKESQKALQELAKIAVLADLTLMLAWSYEEAGRYLETYKAFENKPPDILMERTDSDFLSRATECLTTVKKVNKTDAATLLNNFKTMEKVITASKEDLVLCPGLGPQKARRLHSLFHLPFKTTTKSV